MLYITCAIVSVTQILCIYSNSYARKPHVQFIYIIQMHKKD